MNIIESIILLLSSISLIVYCFISKHSIVLLLTFLCGAIVLTIQFYFKKNIYHRIVQVSIILICLLLGYFNLSSPINKVSKKLYYENKEIFSSQKMIHIFNNDYYENHITALNDAIAKEIFKEEVIRLECYSRGGRHVPENFYHTFDKAIANMKILDLPIVDKGFYNDQYVICIKDNEVVTFRIADVDKEEVIQYYFN